MNLTHTPADILRYALIAASGGTIPSANGSWPIYVSSEPDSPDNCITIYDVAGKKQGRLQVNGRMVEFPGIQVRVRSYDHATGKTRAAVIENILDTIIRRTLVTISASNYIIHAFSRTSQTLDIGKVVNDSKRHLFTLNGMITVTQL